eukprot:6480972-Amphidinium_carterae.1
MRCGCAPRGSELLAGSQEAVLLPAQGHHVVRPQHRGGSTGLVERRDCPRRVPQEARVGGGWRQDGALGRLGREGARGCVCERLARHPAAWRDLRVSARCHAMRQRDVMKRGLNPSHRTQGSALNQKGEKNFSEVHQNRGLVGGEWWWVRHSLWRCSSGARQGPPPAQEVLNM